MSWARTQNPLNNEHDTEVLFILSASIDARFGLLHCPSINPLNMGQGIHKLDIPLSELRFVVCKLGQVQNDF